MAICFNSFGQNVCEISIDTTRILQDHSLDDFISDLQSERFKTFRDKKELPDFVKQQLSCLTKDSFSIANNNELYLCCCTSSQKLPKRKLLFFSMSNDIILITYLTGGFVVSTNFLILKFQGEKVKDIWSGSASSNIKSKEDAVKYLKTKRNKGYGFHSTGYINI
jgi:hypothetical protein